MEDAYLTLEGHISTEKCIVIKLIV